VILYLTNPFSYLVLSFSHPQTQARSSWVLSLYFPHATLFHCNTPSAANFAFSHHGSRRQESAAQISFFRLLKELRLMVYEHLPNVVTHKRINVSYESKLHSVVWVTLAPDSTVENMPHHPRRSEKHCHMDGWRTCRRRSSREWMASTGN
jgi:hypothetical protein